MAKSTVRGPQMEFLTATQKRQGRALVRMVDDVEQAADFLTRSGVVMFVRVPSSLKEDLETQVRMYNRDKRQPHEPRRTLADEVTERLRASLYLAPLTVGGKRGGGVKRGR